MFRSPRRMAAAIACAICSGVTTLHAQWQSTTGPGGAAMGAIVDSDVERYVRALSTGGLIETLPWAARPLGPSDLARLLRTSDTTRHPWAARLARATRSHGAVGAMLTTSYNSSFAWGSNDGAMWQGRGANAAVGLSASFHWGPLSGVLAPIAFSAQNASVPLLLPQPRGVTVDPLFGNNVDLPLRMGLSAYQRVDPGESTLRVDVAGLAAGITTASLGWGPGDAFPALFGANAGGFSRIFAGTSARGVRIPVVGRLTAQYVLGVLEQTPWSPVQGSETYVDVNESGTRRLGTGLVVSYMPSFLPGVELGADRFFHSPWRRPERRWSAWSRPFSGVFKDGLDDSEAINGEAGGDLDNQMASFFARVVFPKRGVEATFELFREDYNWDSRDLAQEPENNSAVFASVHAITERTATHLAKVTLEYFDGNVRPIAQARGQGALYVHGTLRQGHTQRGQLLGSPVGVGAIAGSRVAWERFTPTGSLRINLQRWRPRSSFQGTIDDGLFPDADQPRPYPKYHDWIIDGSVAVTRIRPHLTHTLEAGLAVAPVWQLTTSRTNVYARASVGFF